MKSLKEWAAVVVALESGDQCVILRKGGIMETASGFRTESDRFLLFPTWEHQDQRHIKPRFLHHLDGAESGAPREGFNRITSYADVVAELDAAGDCDISGLSGLHIWSDSYIGERRGWMPEKPLRALLLRVYRIPAVEIPMIPAYRGCRSWIDADAAAVDGTPVLDESQMASRLDTFRSVMG